MLTYRCRAAVFATLVLPAAVVAGPIPSPVAWTYTSTFHAAGQPGAPFVYIGNGGTGAGGSYVLGAHLDGLSELGVTAAPASGSGLFTVGHFNPETYNAAWQNPPTYGRNFELGVTITDAASGQSGTAVFTGYAESLLTEDSMPNPVSLHLTSATSQHLRLGRNVYDLSVSVVGQAPAAGNGDVDAVVGVRPADTPEPATAALAAIGLLGVAGWRRHRRPALSR